MEPEAGTVFIVQSLDYEQEQRYELRLVASDGKWENHTLIIINVVNKNDEAPVFTQNEYYGSVLEELTDLPAFVLKVKCFSCSREKPDFLFFFPGLSRSHTQNGSVPSMHTNPKRQYHQSG